MCCSPLYRGYRSRGVPSSAEGSWPCDANTYMRWRSVLLPTTFGSKDRALAQDSPGDRLPAIDLSYGRWTCLPRRRPTNWRSQAPELMRALRSHWERVGLASTARFTASLACAASLVTLHLGLRKGQALRRWGILENDIAILPRYAHACYDPRISAWLATNPTFVASFTPVLNVGSRAKQIHSAVAGLPPFQLSPWRHPISMSGLPFGR